MNRRQPAVTDVGYLVGYRRATVKRRTVKALAHEEKANGYDPEAVRSAMRRVAENKFRSNREWAAKAGIGEATLRKFMSGGSQAMELDKLMALARAAGMTVS